MLAYVTIKTMYTDITDILPVVVSIDDTMQEALESVARDCNKPVNEIEEEIDKYNKYDTIEYNDEHEPISVMYIIDKHVTF